MLHLFVPQTSSKTKSLSAHELEMHPQNLWYDRKEQGLKQKKQTQHGKL